MGKTVNVVCLEKDASQASAEERDLALEEGANLFDSHSNEAILGTEDQVTGLQVHKINSFYFHPETRALVEDAIPDSTYTIPCDSIVFAAGQVTGPDGGIRAGAQPLRLSYRSQDRQERIHHFGGRRVCRRRRDHGHQVCH